MEFVPMATTKKAPKKKKKPKKKNRGSEYRVGRLLKDRPDIHDELVAGKYPSVTKAYEAAGLKKRPFGLDALKRVWGKSNAPDQDAFLAWAKPPATKVSSSALATICDANNCLIKGAREFLACWMIYNNMNAGRIMQLLGFSPMNIKLSGAIRFGGALDQNIIDLL